MFGRNTHTLAIGPRSSITCRWSWSVGDEHHHHHPPNNTRPINTTSSTKTYLRPIGNGVLYWSWCNQTTESPSVFQFGRGSLLCQLGVVAPTWQLCFESCCLPINQNQKTATTSSSGALTYSLSGWIPLGLEWLARMPFSTFPCPISSTKLRKVNWNRMEWCAPFGVLSFCCCWLVE